MTKLSLSTADSRRIAVIDKKTNEILSILTESKEDIKVIDEYMKEATIAPVESRMILDNLKDYIVGKKQK